MQDQKRQAMLGRQAAKEEKMALINIETAAKVSCRGLTAVSPVENPNCGCKLYGATGHGPTAAMPMGYPCCGCKL